MVTAFRIALLHGKKLVFPEWGIIGWVRYDFLRIADPGEGFTTVEGELSRYGREVLPVEFDRMRADLEADTAGFLSRIIARGINITAVDGDVSFTCAGTEQGDDPHEANVWQRFLLGWGGNCSEKQQNGP